MYNPIGNISKRVQREIEDKSKNTSQVKNFIKTCVVKNSNSQSFIGCKVEDVQFDGDLYYSIQHCNYNVSGSKIDDNNWDINITLYDEYDFDGLRPGFSVGALANNLGYFMQHNGMLVPYHWDVNYSLIYNAK